MKLIAARTRFGRLLMALLLSTGASVGLALSAGAVAQEPGAREEAAAPDSGADEDEVDVDADTGEIEDEGGNKVKVFRFSGLDISGRLKSPQLLYFLNRLRAEFDRPKLPHRSFVPELVRSADEDELTKKN